ncbi:hypothetical protein GCM10009864_40270 [Streptomyces lunalinharesii]|uniref:Uncharacterized protein n=1 Tax=Streptomyces lunalinharesii TaxID=333384 RepID=A0ABN3S3S0_9ACTN
MCGLGGRSVEFPGTVVHGFPGRFAHALPGFRHTKLPFLGSYGSGQSTARCPATIHTCALRTQHSEAVTECGEENPLPEGGLDARGHGGIE